MDRMREAKIQPMNVWRREYFWPAILIVVGIYFLLRNLNLLDWLNGDIVWPVLLIALGVWLIVRRQRA
jgi:ABC-type glycerol-3-phosphate transport system permease component